MFSHIVIIIFSLIFFCSCGNSKFELSIDENMQGWVTIENVSGNIITTNCNSITLSGKAFISPNWSKCCSYNPQDTGVVLSWKNLTTGTTGSATQNVEICYFMGKPYLCNHTWSCSIPLVLGDNEIMVTASDPQGLVGEKSVLIKKPYNSYSISGKIINIKGKGLWNYGLSGFKLTLIGVDSSPYTFTDKEGEYNFSCITDGYYKIIPSSPLEFIFNPKEINVNVNNHDVTNQNFVTDAYVISGRVSNQLMGIAGVNITLENNSNKLTCYTDNDGYYSFIVPNGSYILTPSYCDFIQCHSFLPSNISVTVDKNDISGLDFVVN